MEGFLSQPPFSWPSSARVAAQNLARQWIGVDISPKAVELVNMRLQQSMGNLFRNRLVTARTEIPSRTDIDVRNCSELRGSPAFPTRCGRVAKHRSCFANRSHPLKREQLPTFRCPTGRPCTSGSASRKAGATGVATSSRSASSKWTTSSPSGGWPGQHRQPATTANSLQPGQTRLASGVPKPIPRWDVHFEGLEDYRKDPNTTGADQ